MDEHALSKLILANTVVMGFSVFQKVLAFIFSTHLKKNEKQEHTIDELLEKLSDLEKEVSALKAQVQITLTQIFKIQEIERTVHKLSQGREV